MNKTVTCALIILSLNQVVYPSPVLNLMQANDVTLEEEDSETNVTHQLLDEIKARILKSLHLKEAPKTHAPLPRLQTLNSGDEWENQREYPRAKTKTDFLLADVENITCNDQPCLKINFNLLPQKNFQSAELWLYKKRNTTEFSITHTISINDDEEKERLATRIYNQSEINGWIRFDVSHMIMMENISALEFEVSSDNGKYCLEADGDKIPFLLIHKENVKSISKRSASNCTNESTSCCRETFSVKFEDIGWSDWIIEPSEYEANYCQGSCSGNIGLLSSHHARVLSALCENNPEKAKIIGRPECVSCTATDYGSVSIIFSNESGVFEVSHLPSMTVKECGCA